MPRFIHDCILGTASVLPVAVCPILPVAHPVVRSLGRSRPRPHTFSMIRAPRAGGRPENRPGAMAAYAQRCPAASAAGTPSHPDAIPSCILHIDASVRAIDAPPRPPARHSSFSSAQPVGTATPGLANRRRFQAGQGSHDKLARYGIIASRTGRRASWTW